MFKTITVDRGSLNKKQDEDVLKARKKPTQILQALWKH
jgi:hypothetical protein